MTAISLLWLVLGGERALGHICLHGCAAASSKTLPLAMQRDAKKHTLAYATQHEIDALAYGKWERKHTLAYNRIIKSINDYVKIWNKTFLRRLNLHNKNFKKIFHARFCEKYNPSRRDFLIKGPFRAAHYSYILLWKCPPGGVPQCSLNHMRVTMCWGKVHDCWNKCRQLHLENSIV